MSAYDVIFMFAIYYTREIFTLQHNNVSNNSKHKMHYYFETFEYTTLPSTHAKSPVWDDNKKILYWVDVLNKNVHALNYTSRHHRYRHIGMDEINVVLPILGSKLLFLGINSFAYLLDLDEPCLHCLKFIAALDKGRPGNILNLGKADIRGRFWAGTKGPHLRNSILPDQAALYSLEQPMFEPIVQLKPITISNGMTWSLNNSVFYFIDSATKKIDAFNFNASRGRISERRTVLNLGEYNFMKASPEPIPAGMTIDREGYLWVVLMYGGAIIKINPESKKIVEKYKLPVSRTSAVSWAGPGLEELVVTTSRENMKKEELEKEPLSGALFILHKLGTGGVPENKIIFNNADIY